MLWVSGGLPTLPFLASFPHRWLSTPLADVILSRISGLAKTGELAMVVLTWSLVYAGAGEPEGLPQLSQKAWDVEVARVFFVSLRKGLIGLPEPVFWLQQPRRAGHGSMQFLFPTWEPSLAQSS